MIRVISHLEYVINGSEFDSGAANSVHDLHAASGWTGDKKSLGQRWTQTINASTLPKPNEIDMRRAMKWKLKAAALWIACISGYTPLTVATPTHAPVDVHALSGNHLKKAGTTALELEFKTTRGKQTVDVMYTVDEGDKGLALESSDKTRIVTQQNGAATDTVRLRALRPGRFYLNVFMTMNDQSHVVSIHCHKDVQVETPRTQRAQPDRVCGGAVLLRHNPGFVQRFQRQAFISFIDGVHHVHRLLAARRLEFQFKRGGARFLQMVAGEGVHIHRRMRRRRHRQRRIPADTGDPQCRCFQFPFHSAPHVYLIGLR